MGDPYLNSGESFIITTHRISAGFARFDMMLTTRNLILVDSSSARFEPNKIPLISILSVTAGKVATGEPVITLAFTEDSGTKEQLPKNLLFTQQPGEHRKRERDLWIRKLMEQIVIARQQETFGGAQAEGGSEQAPRLPGSPVRTIEFALPHKSIVSAEPASVDLDVMPEEPDQSVDDMPVQAAIAPVVQPEGDKADLDRTDPLVLPEALPDVPEEEKTAKTEEGTVPAEEAGVLQGTIHSGAPAEPVPAGEVQQEAADSALQRKAGLFERLASTLRSQGGEKSTVPEDSVTSEALPDAGATESSVPAEPVMPTGQPETGSSLEGTMDKTRDEPPFLEEPVPQDGAVCSQKTAPDLSAAREEDIPAVPESGQVMPAVISVAEEPPAVTPEPPEPHLTKEPRQKPGMAALAIIALFLILLALAGGILVSLQFTAANSQNPGVPPATPAVTGPAVTTTPQTPVSHTGVWVRVTCNGSYTGWVGNPGNLMHVGGTGDQLYKITNSDGFVQASFEKQDYSGTVLTVEVYRNGTVIHKRSVGTPKGSLDFIIDAKTGEFPGGIPTPTSASGLVPGQIYRY